MMHVSMMQGPIYDAGSPEEGKELKLFFMLRSMREDVEPVTRVLG